jgi:hypothetical protein
LYPTNCIGLERREDGPARLRNNIDGRRRTDVGDRWVSKASNSKEISRFPGKGSIQEPENVDKLLLPRQAECNVSRKSVLSNVEVESAREGRNRYGFRRYLQCTSTNQIVNTS